MPTVTIARRSTKDGAARFDVRYRLGGRSFPLLHGGTFKSLKDAKARRDMIGGEIAAGRNPTKVLAAMVAAPAPHMTVTAWGDKYLASRIDVDSNTTKNYRTALRKAGETFGDRDPATITVDEVAAWVAKLADTHKPGTVQLYLLTFRLLLDFAAVEPNVARDPRVKLPKQTREEPNPPTAEHVEAILATSARNGGCCSSLSSRARFGWARRCRSGGLMSTPPACGYGSRGQRRSVTVPAGCTCPTG